MITKKMQRLQPVEITIGEQTGYEVCFMHIVEKGGFRKILLRIMTDGIASAVISLIEDTQFVVSTKIESIHLHQLEETLVSVAQIILNNVMSESNAMMAIGK